MKKLGTLFIFLCVVHLLALAGLGAYLYATGRLDKPKAAAILDMLKHKGTPDNFREQVSDLLEPATSSAPASMATTSPDGVMSPLAVSAEDRISAAHAAIDQERIRLQNEAQDLRHRQEMLEHLKSSVDTTLTKIEDAQKVYNQSLVKSDNKSQEESFQKSLALYNELKPKQVKEIFSKMPVELIAKFLQAMDTDRAGKIIAEFKSEEEAKTIAKVLEQIRTNGTGAASGVGATGNTAAVAPGT